MLYEQTKREYLRFLFFSFFLSYLDVCVIEGGFNHVP